MFERYLARIQQDGLELQGRAREEPLLSEENLALCKDFDLAACEAGLATLEEWALESAAENADLRLIEVSLKR